MLSKAGGLPTGMVFLVSIGYLKGELATKDATGKPIKGLPDKGGYFEIRLPKALLENHPKSLKLGWIDFRHP
jgi:hypothetical protein